MKEFIETILQQVAERGGETVVPAILLESEDTFFE